MLLPLLMFGLLAPRNAVASSVESAACGAVRAAIDDLPSLDGSHAAHRYIATTGTGAAIFRRCPVLRQTLPAWLMIADAGTAALDPLPVSGDSRVIFTIELIDVSRDLRTATLNLSYTCSGPCGLEEILRYRRHGDGWARYDSPQLKWVS